ncbi:uncharacterized protein LOC132915984 [Bombus pascuorum]|uniref:uncharacterized protein LOC132915698 n=1 Tax=Bombus pascuorum TaxID=65598 RepID=UPI00298DE8E9|nr:uncharacterized protein LOC132915698 [Bombus pascuorum]XP_060831720.1 uncharacterized protein LOC132915984 [Bombus pascuorum]
MYLMFTYSRVAAGRRCGARQIADPVRRTSEKLVGPYLSRPLTSPSRGASRHPASVPTGVGCERVSGTKTRRHQHTIKQTLDDEDNYDMSENINNEVYGAGEGYPSTGADVGGQAGPAVSLACDGKIYQNRLQQFNIETKRYINIKRIYKGLQSLWISKTLCMDFVLFK